MGAWVGGVLWCGVPEESSGAYQIPMQDLRTVYRFQPAEYLIQEEPDVVVGQLLFTRYKQMHHVCTQRMRRVCENWLPPKLRM